MAVLRVTYKVKREGPTPEEVNELLVDRFVFSVLEDHRHTPDEFRGQGRRGRTPFKRSGELVSGLHFKRAGSAARRTGVIGVIRAPADRFKSGVVRDKFMDRYLLVLRVRGQAWSIARAGLGAALDAFSKLPRAARDAVLAGKGGL